MTQPSPSSNGTYIGTGVVIGIVLIALAVYLIFFPHTAKAPAVPVTIADPATLPGIATGTPPWPVELAHLTERLAADSLPALSEEGTVLHIHQHLDLYVHGAPIAIPAGIGINELAGYISPIHVHDETGIIHVESPYAATFTLGEFFDIWGVTFTQNCIGSYCTSGNDSLKIFVNGELYTGDPRMLALDAHQEIVIAFGTDSEIPAPLPKTYTFPAGY